MKQSKASEIENKLAAELNQVPETKSEPVKSEPRKRTIKPINQNNNGGGKGSLSGGEGFEKDGKAPMKANSDTKALVERFIADLTDMEVKKQKIMEEIKDLKSDYKEDGLPVGVINSMFKIVQKNKKKSDGELFEEETIREWLEESKIVDEACLKLQK